MEYHNTLRLGNRFDESRAWFDGFAITSDELYEILRAMEPLDRPKFIPFADKIYNEPEPFDAETDEFVQFYFRESLDEMLIVEEYFCKERTLILTTCIS